MWFNLDSSWFDLRYEQIPTSSKLYTITHTPQAVTKCRHTHKSKLLVQSIWILGMCGKPKFCSDSVFKNWSKNLTSVQTVFWQKLHAICHSNKSNFTCIKCADKERFITWWKKSLARIFYNAITLFTCCHGCQWHQWCQSCHPLSLLYLL